MTPNYIGSIGLSEQSDQPPTYPDHPTENDPYDSEGYYG